MTRLVFDLETDGHLDELTRIHCIATRDIDNPDTSWVFGPHQIDEGLAQLAAAEEICGHNVLGFDIPAIQKVRPFFSTDHLKVTDTLVLSRLIRCDLKNDDYASRMTAEEFPKKYYGSHGLKAWGFRLGIHKGDFGEQTDWAEWSQGMQDYCERDVEVTLALLQELKPHEFSEEAIAFEHRIAEICHRIGLAGWTFDNQAAAELYAQLVLERDTIEEELQTLFPDWIIETDFVPKVNNAKLGYEKGVPFIKQKTVQFNPNSRKHIEYNLRKKYNWKPKVFTLQGDAKIDETVLASLPYDEAQKLARSFMLQKRIGQLAEGKNAWMRLVDEDGKLRHNINPNGTVTGRASSFGPNLQQVPSLRAEFGLQCRQLFQPSAGYTLLGADLKGLELRCLAGFLHPIDGGKYAKVVLEGDVHQANADMVGIDRPSAKTMIYALCFGAGDTRLGQILGAGPQAGRALRQRFFKANPAFETLVRRVKNTANQRGFLRGLDQRQLPVRSDHAALNVLLQSAGALISKKWVELVDAELRKQNLDARLIAWIHDEIQLEVAKKEDIEHVGRITRRMAQEAGEAFNFAVAIDADFSVGSDWAATH